MHVGPPEIITQDGMARLQAPVTVEKSRKDYPEKLWFEVDQAHASMLYTGAESFVTALLPLAMCLGEDIHIDAPISPQLAYHLGRVQQVMQHLDPGRLRPIQIHHGGLMTEVPRRPPGVGLTFSGGVDSFFTLQQNVMAGEQHPGYAITHGIFLFRFDLAEYELESYEKSAAVYDALFERLGKTLVRGSYNARKFSPYSEGRASRSWHLRTHPFGLAGMGMAMSSGLGRQFISSSQPFDEYGRDYGGDFEIQQSLSTEWLEMIHDGLVENRVQKTLSLAEWPEAYDSLRVCWWDPDGVQNCGRCPKCVRTMTTLKITRQLDLFSTFPRPYRPRLVLTRLSSIKDAHYLREIQVLALKNGRTQIAVLARIALWTASLKAFIKRLIQTINPSFRNPGG